jgi:catechol 2,3-dioxygenase-like lactoylglutathione lyase family enzyme
MEHVGIVVDDLAAATEFFVELGLAVLGEALIRAEFSSTAVVSRRRASGNDFAE